VRRFSTLTEGDEMKPNTTLIVLSISAALTTASATAFASPTATDHTLVGAWRTVVTLVNCQTGQPVGAPPIIGLSTFNHGGTMSEWGIGPGSSPAQRSPSHGVWQRDHGQRDFSFTFLHYRYDLSGAFIGSQRVAADATLAKGGDRYDSIAAVEIIDAGNHVVATACATSVGTRIE
jgi:hypothetical protein